MTAAAERLLILYQRPQPDVVLQHQKIIKDLIEQFHAVENEVIAYGQECVVWITGDPDDATGVTTFDLAMKVIREAHRLGQQRNNEANELRLDHNALRVEVNRLQWIVTNLLTDSQLDVVMPGDKVSIRYCSVQTNTLLEKIHNQDVVRWTAEIYES